MHMHDVIFHVIFGSDMQSIYELVHASAVRLHSITQCPFLSSMMNAIASERSSMAAANALLDRSACHVKHGPDLIKALFFLFMNVDMVLKEYVCNPGCKKAFAAALNAKRAAAPEGNSSSSSVLQRTHAWSMMGTRAMDPAKARRFFVVLHDSIIKLWLQDERLCASDLVQMVKDEYLVS